jgi:cytoskeletal protein RodZ
MRLGGDAVGEFGSKFRREREKKGFSLDDVSNVTKIGTRMLQAIEEEQFERLPGGVFNKGFIRAYAKHLGMNDEQAVASYLECVRRAQGDALGASEPERRTVPERRGTGGKGAGNKGAAGRAGSRAQGAAAVSSRVSSQVSTQDQDEELPELQLPRAEHVRPPRNKYLEGGERGIPWRIPAAAALVIVLALILWSRRAHSPRTEVTVAAPVSSIPAAPVPVSAGSPTAGGKGGNADSAHASGTSAPGSAAAQAPAAARPVATAKPVANSVSANDGAAGSGQSANVAAAAKAAAPLTLIIRASENSWISVLADGQEVTSETLIAPAHTSVRANREIIVKTGNAAGVNFLWNGKEVPAQGTEAEVMTFVFDADGVRTNPAAAAPVQNQ